MPASEVDHRGHEAALLPRNGAAESFVSFIPLFDGAARPRRKRGPLGLCCSSYLDLTKPRKTGFPIVVSHLIHSGTRRSQTHVRWP